MGIAHNGDVGICTDVGHANSYTQIMSTPRFESHLHVIKSLPDTTVTKLGIYITCFMYGICYNFIIFSVCLQPHSGVFGVNANAPEGEWTQMVMVYNGRESGIRVHVNDKVISGSDCRSKSVNGGLSSGHVVIGKKYVENDSRYCSSMVDELMLWNRSLTTQEAEYLMTIY